MANAGRPSEHLTEAISPDGSTWHTAEVNVTNVVVSGGATATVHPAAASISLDKVNDLIRRTVIAPAVKDVAEQQAYQKELVPTRDAEGKPVKVKPEMHHVSEGYVSSAVQRSVSQGLLGEIVALLVKEMLGHFNKPVAPAPAVTTGGSTVTSG